MSPVGERLVARDGAEQLWCVDGRWYWARRGVVPDTARGGHGTGEVTTKRCLGALGSDEAAVKRWRKEYGGQ